MSQTASQPEGPAHQREPNVTTTFNDFFPPDPLAHAVPTKDIELEFSIPAGVRYNQWRLIQGLLTNAGPNTLVDRILLDERNVCQVALI